MSLPETDRDTILDLVLRPHRSLSPLGFSTIMTILIAFSFAGGIVFWWLGAWPIIGFLGLDVLLVYIAFKASYAGGRAYERLRLSPAALHVERVHASGRCEAFTLQPYWLRVEIETEPAQDNRLLLASHGRKVAIGSFLSADERVEVAAVLRDGLARLHETPGVPRLNGRS